MQKKYKCELFPALDDNYVFVIHDESTKQCIIVDPCDSGPLISYLEYEDLIPQAILITHHHADHTEGVEAILEKFKVPVYAPEKEKNKFSLADIYLKENDQFELMGMSFQVQEFSGHTQGHIAYFEPNLKWLFSGDILFGMGCGRIFEGTHQEMFDSLQKIKTYPDDTQVFCTHEYTERNVQFWILNFPDMHDMIRYQKEIERSRRIMHPTVPLTLSKEKELNPFLKFKTVNEFKKFRDLRNLY